MGIPIVSSTRSFVYESTLFITNTYNRLTAIVLRAFGAPMGLAPSTLANGRILPLQQRLKFPALEGLLPKHGKKEQTATHGDAPDAGPLEADLQALVDQGFASLAKSLSDKSGFPWDEIRAIGHGSLTQQLVDLVGITQGKPNSEKTIRFALALARSGHNEGQLQQARSDIGALIYFCDQDLALTNTMIDSANPTDSVSRLREKLTESLEIERKEVEAHTKGHERSLLQDAIQARNTYIPQAMANLLTTSSGAVNFGLIEVAKDALIPEESRNTGYCCELLRGLDLLERSPALRDKLAAVEAPVPGNRPGQRLVWQSLGRPPGSKITHVDAKKVAMGGMLSHLRQGSVGSCFATFLGIEVMHSRLGRCVDDLAALIRDGKITLEDEDGIEEDFPFLLRMSLDSGDTEFAVWPDGELETEGAFLWEAPGIRAACIAAGIQESAIEGLVKDTVAKFWEKADDDDESVDLAMHTFLKGLATQIATRNGKAEEEILQTLVIAIEAQTANPLLRVWEYTLASMAEAKNDSYMKERSLGSLTKALCENVDKIMSGNDEIKREIVVRVVTKFLERAKLQYDPSITNPSHSADGHSTSGGFVLFDKRGSCDTDDWIRVGSGEAYRTFIHDLAKEVSDEIGSGPGDKKSKALMGLVCTSLTEYLGKETSKFVGEVASIYNYGRVAIRMLNGDPDLLTHTPWLDRIGNMPQQVWKVYFNREMAEGERIQPKDATDLMMQLVSRIKNGCERGREYFRTNPQALIPVRTPGKHAFSLMPGDPSLRALWENPNFDKEWVENNIIAPGKQVANTVVTKQAKDAMLQRLKDELVDDENHQALEVAFSQLPSEATYGTIRKTLEAAVNRTQGYGFVHPVYLRLHLDSLLFDTLPLDLRKTMVDSSVKFADTNWNSDAHDIHFSFMYNPFDGDLEVWRSLDDNSNFEAVSQQGWVTRPWEFARDLGDLIPDDDEEVDIVDQRKAS